jgi:murein DD-endopeptidase MepM/ murein hydrolase activator NlpD
MTFAQRDLASTELWDQSLERSLRRRALAPRARREDRRRKRLSLAVVAATVAGPGTPAAMAQASGSLQAEVAAETPSHRAIEVREGGLPLTIGSQGALVAEVQKALSVRADGIFGPETEAAVRSYQARAGLSVDGIVGPATWSTLFADSAVGGSNVPQAVRERIEQRLASAMPSAPAESAVPAESAPSTVPGASAPATAPAESTPATAPAPAPTQGEPAPATEPVQTGAPGTGSCGSATISTPVRGTVTSPFGPRGGRNHDGVDIAAPTGTPVRAAACGSVSMAGQQSGYGNIVCITHTSQFSTCYAHLSRFATSQGAQVQQGQVIGYVGCTGNCTGPHLHFETRINGQPQNPSTYLAGGSIPGRSKATSATHAAPTRGVTASGAQVSHATASGTAASGTATSSASLGGATTSGSGGAGAVAPAASPAAPAPAQATATSAGSAPAAATSAPPPATPAAPAPASTAPAPATPAAPAPAAPAPAAATAPPATPAQTPAPTAAATEGTAESVPAPAPVPTDPAATTSAPAPAEVAATEIAAPTEPAQPADAALPADGQPAPAGPDASVAALPGSS